LEIVGTAQAEPDDSVEPPIVHFPEPPVPL
jgi:hypothetical protein